MSSTQSFKQQDAGIVPASIQSLRLLSPASITSSSMPDLHVDTHTPHAGTTAGTTPAAPSRSRMNSVAVSNIVTSAQHTENEMTVHYHTIKHALSIRIQEKRQQSIHAKSVRIEEGGTAVIVKDVPAEIAIDLQQSMDALDTTVHTMSLADIMTCFTSNMTCGLSNKKVAELQEKHGKNELTPSPPPSWLWLLVKQLLAGFNSVLWLAALFAFLSYQPFGEPQPDPTQLGLGVVLILVVLLNSGFNLYQEVKSVRIVASFAKMLPTMASVLRDGVVQQVLASELVVGDIVHLSIGDKVPADMRILECSGLQVNNSALTGESEPVQCTVKHSHLNYLESTNIVFYSSLVVQGSGTGVVVATGDNTVLGTVSALTRGSSNVEVTSLHREINIFVLIIVSFAAFFAVLIWITWSTWLNASNDPKYVGYLTENGNVINSIGLVVAFVPEGLPAAVTLILTIVATRMYQQHVLVKSLATLETFNSVSIIATDKTGTLTMNIMTITRLLWGATGEYMVPIADNANDTVGQERNSTSQEHPAFVALMEGAALCNVARQQESDDGTGGVQTQLIGDAADTALYHLVQKNKSGHSQKNNHNNGVEEIRAAHPRVALLPFNSTNKCMITAHSTDGTHIVHVIMKGAPEIILTRCSHHINDAGTVQDLTPEISQAILARQEQYGKSGYRVIAMIQQEVEADQLYAAKATASTTAGGGAEQVEFNGLPAQGYTFVGLFTLLDPPRPEVPASVKLCRQAQIRVAMVTGDHPATAIAIAHQCDIFSAEITDKNGLDSMKLGVDELSRTIIQLMRNGTVMERHVLGPISKAEDVQLAAMTKPIKGAGAKWGKGKGKNQELSLSSIWHSTRSTLHSIWSHIRGLFYSSSNVVDRPPTTPYGVVVTGADLKLFDDWMWDWVLSHQEIVFARTSPEQKLRIVMHLQARGEVVSVTGDGTNDAPALRKADLGVAMRSGTEVAREAGELVLLDNNFASIIQAIETGRLLSDNLKKVCVYLLPAGSWSELMPVLANEWIGVPLALSAFQMIIICMLTDLCGALAMVNEQAEADIMKRPPVIRNKEHLVNTRLIFHAYGLIGNIETLAAFFNYLWFWNDHGIPPSQVFLSFNNFGNETNYSADELLHLNQVGQSIFFVTLVIMQFFNLCSTRTRYASFFSHNPFYGRGQNLYILVGMTMATLIAIIVTQPAWFHDTFKTQAVPVKYIMPALGFGTALFLIDECRKWILRHYPNSLVAKCSW